MVFLQSKNYIVTSAFSTDTEQCPVPEKASSNLTCYDELPLKGLFKNKVNASSFAVIKEQIENFIKVNKKEEEHSTKFSSVPDIVNLDDKTIASTAASSKCSVQNERIIAFL